MFSIRHIALTHPTAKRIIFPVLTVEATARSYTLTEPQRRVSAPRRILPLILLLVHFRNCCDRDDLSLLHCCLHVLGRTATQ